MGFKNTNESKGEISMTDNIPKYHFIFLSEWLGIIPTPEQYGRLIANYPDIRKKLDNWSKNRDTLSAEEAASSVSMAFLGRQWVTYGEGEENVDKFYSDLKLACDKAGIEHSIERNLQ